MAHRREIFVFSDLTHREFRFLTLRHGPLTRFFTFVAFFAFFAFTVSAETGAESVSLAFFAFFAFTVSAETGDESAFPRVFRIFRVHCKCTD